MSAIIELKNVKKSFLRHRVLDGVSLTVEAGTTIGVVGSNGSGKSVLFQIICGFYAPDSGSVRVRGETLGKGRDFPENIGVLINAPGFIGPDTGIQNLRYLAAIQGVIGDREIRDAMRKVGLAQAIMEGQDILILDEPFNALDYKTYNDVKEIIRILQAEGKTILLTSHNYEDLESLCQKIYVMADGRLGTLSSEEMRQRFRE